MRRFALFLGLFLCFSLSAITLPVLAGTVDISVKEAYELASKGEVLLIDVRAEEEWKQTGVAENAHMLSMHQKGGVDKLVKDLMVLVEGNKDQPLAIICAGGVRSVKVSDHLEERGFTKLYNVKEGMVGGFFSRGWIDQGLPVKRYYGKGTENF